MKSFGEFSHDLQEKNVPDNPALWKKAIAKAKEKFDVYPSAYANAWASKWYKGEGGTWSVQKEEVEIDEKSLHPDLHKIVKTKDGYQLMMYSPSDGKFVARGKPQPTERKAEKAALVFASVKVDEEDEDKKPLMTWFAQFEKELKKSGGKYKDVDPTDMLKLYYKGIKPKAAVKELL